MCISFLWPMLKPLPLMSFCLDYGLYYYFFFLLLAYDSGLGTTWRTQYFPFLCQDLLV